MSGNEHRSSSNWAEIGRVNVEEGRLFEDRVAEIYRLMNYDVEHGRLFSGRQVDLFLTGRFGDLRVHRAIECKAGAVRADQIDAFLNKLRLVRHEYPAALGTIVSDTRFTDAIAAQAAREGVQLTLYRDLAAELLDGHAYAQRLIRECESNTRYQMSLYVEPTIALEPDGAGVLAFDLVRQWLSEAVWSQLTLLGDMGTGKSFLSKMIAHRMARSYLREPLSNPLPILIDLRNADRHFSLEGLVITHLNNSGLPRVSFEVFQYALSQGSIVLILDGFDEMAARVTPQVTLRNFNELARSVAGGAKVLLTCRTHYFRSKSEEEEVVLGNRTDYDSDTVRELYWELIARKGYQIAYLKPFTRSQVEEYVRKAKGEFANVALDKIRHTYNLMELSHRPMLLEMIVKSLDKLTSDEINASTLYQVYTDAWVHRDQWRDVLTSDQKVALLTTLAQTLWVEDSVAIHYSRLAEYLQSELATRIQNVQQFIEIDNEIRTASFLTRDEAGNYGFAHKSFSEFFIARYLLGELSMGRLDCLNMRRVSPEIIGFLTNLVNNVDVDLLLESVLLDDYRPLVSENALLILYALRKANFLSNHSQKEAAERLFSFELPRGMQLSGASLDQVSLEGVFMIGANLNGANLSQAGLSRANLSGSSLVGTNLDKSNLIGTILENADCTRASFVGANLERAILDGALFRQADFSDSNLLKSSSAGVNVENALFLGAMLPAEIETAAGVMWEAIHQLWPWVNRVAMFYGRSFGVDPEELASDATYALMKPHYAEQLRKFSDQQSKEMVDHLVYEMAATLGRRRFYEQPFSSLSEGKLEAIINSQPVAASDFDTTLGITELVEHLRTVLSEQTFEVFCQHYLHGLSIQEISATQKRSDRWVQNHLRKAREIARARFSAAD